jgi:hypothetical protein
MATITQGNFVSAKTVADLRTKVYFIVKLDTNRQAVLASASTDEISGVLDEVPQGSNGGTVSIMHVSANGTGKVSAGAAISKGAYLTSDANGQAVAATQTAAGSQPTKRVFGRALEAAAAQNDIIEFEHCFFLY